MNLRSFLYLFSLTGALILTSCGNEDSRDNNTGTAENASPELASLNTAIKDDPDNAEKYYARAKYYYENKKINEGLSDITRALSIDSSKAAYFVTLSDLYFAGNKTGASKTALEKAVRLDDKNTEAMLKLAELHLYVRQYDKSIEHVNMALKVDPYIAKAYFIKGMNYKELKDTAKAISSMQTAVEQDKQYYQAFMQLGLLCAAIRDPLAIQYYQNALRLEPKSYEAWYGLGKFYQDIGEWNKALETYASILEMNYSVKNVHYNMAVVNMVGLKNYEQALKHFDDLLSIDPDYAEGYYARGVCYQSMGKKDKAKNDFESALKIAPNMEMAKEALKGLK